jgi:hypothetical protein
MAYLTSFPEPLPNNFSGHPLIISGIPYYANRCLPLLFIRYHPTMVSLYSGRWQVQSHDEAMIVQLFKFQNLQTEIKANRTWNIIPR